MAPLWLALALAGAANEPVTVEVVAVGHVDAPATRFVLAVDLTATGDTEAKAKAALATKKAALLQQLSAAGATLVPEESGATKAASIKLDAFETSTDKTEEKPSASESFSVQATTRVAINAAREFVSRTEGASADQAPVSSISDTTVANRAAKRDAIAKAKLDAQNYADSLGYANATVVKVSERGDLGTLVSYGMSIAARGPKNIFEPSRGDTVPIDVAVTVTFRLDGKK
ncbi:MAG: SIMPL domain-containing protein [Sphingomonas sp.]|uniref:SIMPL domain-containing protein n=1 Tax=Sphingomonas sp. TaxID=28214 RepID=UPI001AD2D19B|nr:SIMPL domain-containing protein [Sphingomonas sp.]MBN8814935.1 SIMPL domain-containing protein [Sphingomonas sp.]